MEDHWIELQQKLYRRPYFSNRSIRQFLILEEKSIFEYNRDHRRSVPRWMTWIFHHFHSEMNEEETNEKKIFSFNKLFQKEEVQEHNDRTERNWMIRKRHRWCNTYILFYLFLNWSKRNSWRTISLSIETQNVPASIISREAMTFVAKA